MRCRGWLHPGQQRAGGVWLQQALSGLGEARSRVAQQWTEGDQLYPAPGGMLWLFVEPRMLDAGAAPGALLVWQQRLWTSAPLDQAQLDQLDPLASVALVWGGQLWAEPLGAPIDPSDWLDVTPFEVSEVRTLGELVTAQLPAAESLLKLRDLLAVPPPAEAQRAFLEQTAQPAGTRRKQPNAWWQQPWVQGIMRLLISWLSPRAADSAAGSTSTQLQARAAPSTGWLERWRRALIALVMSTQLARLLGRQQADYLRRMLNMFDAGDLDNALRHAIPLSKLPDPNVGPSFSAPRPRHDLSLRAGPRAPARSALLLDGELFGGIRQLYERAAERLLRDGNIERAAFVYIELLGQTERGVALLERHGMVELAASVAQSHGLAPGLVVRLWFVAGEGARALALARLTGCFADAV